MLGSLIYIRLMAKRKSVKKRATPKRKPPAPPRARARAARRRAQHGPPTGDPEPGGRGWVEDRRVVGGVVCQLQFVRCGKKCWCMKTEFPPWHGPYWFAYVANKRGKLAARYVGKELSAARVNLVAG